MPCRTIPLHLLAMVCLSSASAFAQDPQVSDPPAHISFVDGPAVLERDGRTDSELTSMPVLAGDRVRTQGGRVEVLFADGSALHMDSNTVVDFQSDEVVRLLDGRIRLAIAASAREVSYRVDAPSAWVQITNPGEYRIAVLNDAEVELAVLRGAAELVNEQGRSYIRAGERTFARAGAAPSPPYVFNSAAWDAFDRWSEARRDQRLGLSTQYLPSDVRPYAASFDAYGDWRYEQAYGYVWYPRVNVGWRPYYHGRWAGLRPYGWTWISGDPWGWPTHHYGRWGFSSGLWFWIPGRHWAPAWVSWAYAPSYVSWCPLGWNNRPVQFVNVNVYGGRHYNPWHAWTAVPRRHFSGPYVSVSTATAVRIDQRLHNTLVVGASAPATHFAVPRSVSPIRSAGRIAVPRGAAPSTFSSTAAPGGVRASTGGNQIGDERRFPAPARPSRTPTALSSPQITQGTRSTTAIPRERSVDDSTITAPRAATAGVDASDFRRGTDAGGRRRSIETTTPGEPAVTAAPSGAVRAVPRVRQPVDQSASPYSGVPGERARIREERAPVYSAPSSSPPPSNSPPPRGAVDPDGNRSYRREPTAGAEYRGRAEPRQDSPAPSYRSAPERRAPSGPPPAASAPSGPPPAASSPSPRSSGGGRQEAGPPSRQPSGESSSSGGQARRRR